MRGRLFSFLVAASSIGYGLVWCGIAVAIKLIVHALRSRAWAAREHIAAIVLVSIICQAVIDGVSAKFQHPHYQNGTWPSFVLLAWFAVDFVASGRRAVRWAAPAATGLLAATLLLAVGTLAVRLHRSRGTRDIYGPTLANQQQIARSLARYAPTSEVQTHVNMWQRFPHTLAILRELNPSRRADGPRRVVELRYASGDQSSGAIEMVAR